MAFDSYRKMDHLFSYKQLIINKLVTFGNRGRVSVEGDQCLTTRRFVHKAQYMVADDLKDLFESEQGYGREES